MSEFGTFIKVGTSLAVGFAAIVAIGYGTKDAHLPSNQKLSPYLMTTADSLTRTGQRANFDIRSLEGDLLKGNLLWWGAIERTNQTGATGCPMFQMHLNYPGFLTAHAETDRQIEICPTPPEEKIKVRPLQKRL
jgi:hypothetical protein